MTEPSRNIASWERWASVMGGAALIGRGLLRPNHRNVALVAGGAWLLGRGLIGYCAVYQALGLTTRRDGAFAPADPPDAVDAASEDSFPASDPPFFSPMLARQPHRRA